MVKYDLISKYTIDTDSKGKPSSNNEKFDVGLVKIEVGEHWLKDQKSKRLVEKGGTFLGNGGYKFAVMV